MKHLVLVALVACKPPDAATQTDTSAPRRELTVARGEIVERVLLTGQLRAANSVDLIVPKTDQWNLTIRWMAEDGASVKAGDKVLEFDNSAFTNGLQQKYLFKKAMEGILPDEVIWRGKAGFGAPIRRWLKGDLRPLVDDLLGERSLRNRGFFAPAAIRSMVDANANDQADHAYRIWALMTFELWCRTFLDKRAA